MNEDVGIMTKNDFTNVLEGIDPVSAFRIPADTEQMPKAQMIKQFSETDGEDAPAHRAVVPMGKIINNQELDMEYSLVAVFELENESATPNQRASCLVAMLSGHCRNIRGDVCIYAVEKLEVQDDGEPTDIGNPIPFPEDLAEYLSDSLGNGPSHLMFGPVGMQIFKHDPGRMIEIALKTGLVNVGELLGNLGKD
jgi:hypothetical protein